MASAAAGSPQRPGRAAAAADPSRLRAMSLPGAPGSEAAGEEDGAAGALADSSLGASAASGGQAAGGDADAAGTAGLLGLGAGDYVITEEFSPELSRTSSQAAEEDAAAAAADHNAGASTSGGGASGSGGATNYAGMTPLSSAALQQALLRQVLTSDSFSDGAPSPVVPDGGGTARRRAAISGQETSSFLFGDDKARYAYLKQLQSGMAPPPEEPDSAT